MSTGPRRALPGTPGPLGGAWGRAEPKHAHLHPAFITDGNLHFQDAARLVRRLLELEKEFEVMIYPQGAHIFAPFHGRYDYYRGIADLFRRELLEWEGG